MKLYFSTTELILLQSVSAQSILKRTDRVTTITYINLINTSPGFLYFYFYFIGYKIDVIIDIYMNEINRYFFSLFMLLQDILIIRNWEYAIFLCDLEVKGYKFYVRMFLFFLDRRLFSFRDNVVIYIRLLYRNIHIFEIVQYNYINNNRPTRNH